MVKKEDEKIKFLGLRLKIAEFETKNSFMSKMSCDIKLIISLLKN